MRSSRPPVRPSALCAAILSALAIAAPGIGQNGQNELPSPVRNSHFYSRGRPAPAQVELGKMLFFDKILSGNLNISCATCHHALTATGDGLSLPVGEGGQGLGVTRDTGRGRSRIVERVPRNAPPIFNLGAREFRRMFHDGRVERQKAHPSGFRSPAGDALPAGLDNVLAAQAMFPVTSPTEMAGQAGENPIANAAASGDLPQVWELLAERLRSIPAYVDLFLTAFPELGSASEIHYLHAANAIGAFEAVAWRADRSPFDRFLRGDASALSRSARRGLRLFYGDLGCSGCHAGRFQTDHRFHAIAMPQIGPGKGDGGDGHDDFGRERVTGARAGRYQFRTPSLRNVALTGPWGHDGAYDSLREIVLHHLDPANRLEAYDPTQAVLPSRSDLDRLDRIAFNDPARRAAIAGANELEPRQASARDVDDLLEFLRALTDPNSLDLRGDVPRQVPSGLPLAE